MPVKLAFGTAGIRARLGEADHELNVRTVRAVAHALFGYVGSLVPDARERGICIGYDGRRESQRFAQQIAVVALGHGFRVRSFEQTVPMPVLAFSTKLHQAAVGIMVTASHNPPEDNGIKVYLGGGAQILPPHDVEIARRIASLDDSESIPERTVESARAAGDWLPLGASEEQKYLDAVLELVPIEPARTLPVIAYSALCGVGGRITRALMAQTGSELVEVSSQAEPREDFGGLSSPNPEHPVARAELAQLSRQVGAELGFCHDPDADRLAVLAVEARGSARERNHNTPAGEAGELRALSGDEVGALLVDYLLSLEVAPEQCLVVSTIVSGSLAERITQARGAHFERTLTGFKWIAERGRALERTQRLHYLFGYEEALGYCFARMGDDKDGIAAMHVLLELTRRLHAQGYGLSDRLEQLARQHGLFVSRQVTTSASGDAGLARMRATLATLRKSDPADWLGRKAQREDFLDRAVAADLLVFRTSAGARVSVRPSGTEPKLKFYLEACEPVAADEALETAHARAEDTLNDLEERIRGLR